MLQLSSSGSFKNTFAYLKYLLNGDYLRTVDSYAQLGVEALQIATPKDSGETAGRWSYKISIGIGRTEIAWYNDSVISTGIPIVILLQYGHGTGTGGYVQGIDFINPALSKVFDDILEGVGQAVRSI